MKNIIVYTFLLTFLLASCGESLEKKKETLKELKSQAKEIDNQIAQLENEIAQMDTTFSPKAKANGNAILVATAPVEMKDFIHKIEVRGSVASKKNVLISSEIGGKIQSVRVDEGERVRKGQVLVMLDADVIRNNIEELKTSLELAEAVYKRQANLWEKNIGTEIQYLEAKNKKESLERRLATAKSQLDQAIITAPFTGTVDQIPAKEGELASPGMPLIRMVNDQAMHVEADISERYIGNFKKGDVVELYFPVQEKRFTSKISFVSEVINNENRTFAIEVELPQLDFKAKPNQVVILKLTDYQADEAVVVPTEIILSDNEGKFLYTITEEGEKKLAKKRRVEAGSTYDGKTEIRKGLSASDKIITEGYRNVTDGVLVEIAEKNTKTAKL
ncbi:MAG: efflux RND transporter periplasmic adaptor subunit [Fulvivirga sp.]|nr:efflux RND transporter periplasmic adaptor subunit [Fulvivirga sp.]